VLLPWGSQIEQAAAVARVKLNEEVLAGIVELIPDAWLDAIASPESTAEKRVAYAAFLTRRLKASKVFEQEAIRAHARLV
jgi:hypothetical protein